MTNGTEAPVVHAVSIDQRTGVDDLWTWRVKLKDGSYINEIDELGDHVRGWSSVPHDQVSHIIWEPQVGGLQVYAVEVGEHEEPVLFRRRSIDVSQSGESAVHQHVHVAGVRRMLHKGHEAKNCKEERGAPDKCAEYSLLFILEDGSSLLSSDYQRMV